MNARLVLAALLAVATIGLLVWAFADQSSSMPGSPAADTDTGAESEAPGAEPAASKTRAPDPAPAAPRTPSPPPDPASPDGSDLDGPSTPPAEQPLEPTSRRLSSSAGQPEEPKDLKTFPDNWFFADRTTGGRRAIPQSLEGKPMPRLQVRQWVGEPANLDDLRGKVVVVDFWATWCGPCVRSIPHNVQLVEKYGDEDFLFIGVHDSRRGFDKAPALAERAGINYPIGVDDAGVSKRAWKVSFWPTYAVVDRNGIVRAAGLMPRYIEPVVEALLAEE
ncbi:MAG: TlpA disulfide reductase family protein [Planctomycetota bacterium]|nr:TlpA disulfide reductase family protein [Planctomycetota bacterium]